MASVRSNEIVFQFIRFLEKERSTETDATLTVVPMKRGYKLTYYDPNLKHIESFQLGSTQRLVDYLNHAISLIKLDKDQTGAFKYIQISLPHFPDTLIPIDTQVNVKFGKVIDTIRQFHATK
jgi:hypothetical protein